MTDMTSPGGLLNEYYSFLLTHSDVVADGLAPALPAADGQIAAAEEALGVVFDDEYRAMLSSADGWPDLKGIYQLYGTADFLARPRGADNRVDNLIPDAVSYFSSEEFDDPAESVVFDQPGYRSVVVGRSAVSSRFFVMSFPTSSHERRSVFYDCMSGDDSAYDGIGSWFDEQRAIVLGEEV